MKATLNGIATYYEIHGKEGAPADPEAAAAAVAETRSFLAKRLSP